MRIRVGCEFHYESPGPTAAIWQVRPRPGDAQRMVSELWSAMPATPSTFYFDVYGNLTDRMTLPEGASDIRYDAVFEVPGQYDEADKEAREIPVVDLPNEALVYLLPSRFCLSDVLYDKAWDLFGAVEPGWTRVQAVSDWVHDNVRFEAGSSTPTTSAVTVFETPDRGVPGLRPPRRDVLPEPQHPGSLRVRVSPRHRGPAAGRSHGFLCVDGGLPGGTAGGRSTLETTFPAPVGC